MGRLLGRFLPDPGRDTRLHDAVRFGAAIYRAPEDGVFSGGPVARVIDGAGGVVHGPLRGDWQIARARLWGVARLHVWLKVRRDQGPQR